jgi:ubiquinone/menaquinone biosynthesis C-methylase UbiE/uncharacterized protein YbaR (Trm112 family)
MKAERLGFEREIENVSPDILDHGFPLRFIGVVRCPRDGGDLALGSSDRPAGEAISRGSLSCKFCGHSFPIVNGILRFIELAQLDEEALLEVKLRDEQGRLSQEQVRQDEARAWSKLEIPQHVAALNLDSKSVLLEVACGRGRFTVQFLKVCRTILAVDFSLASLEALARRLAPGIEVGLIHADITQLRLAPQSFDRAFSTTPLDSREQRMTMFRTISDALTDDGVYVFSVEHYDLRTRLLGNPRLTRYPNGGSVFQRFMRDEAEREAAPYFLRVKSRPIQIFLPFVRSVLIGRSFEQVPLLRNFGNLLLVRALNPMRTPKIDQCTQGSRLFRSVYRWLKLPDVP